MPSEENGRHEFSGAVKSALAARVGNRCSNPKCRALTSGPHTDPGKNVNVGVASHITAAANGGPRYDPALSPEERASPSNGIWLCQSCGKLVDNDPVSYSVAILHNWKHRAELEAYHQVGQTAAVTPPDAPEKIQAAIRSVIVEMLQSANLGLSGSSTAIKITGQPPFPGARRFSDEMWQKHRGALAAVLDVQGILDIATAYTDARDVFRFAGEPYPDTPFAVQFPWLLARVASDFVEAAARLCTLIADPQERAEAETNIKTMNDKIVSQRKVTG